jgi:hypothetical protein
LKVEFAEADSTFRGADFMKAVMKGVVDG